MAEKKITIVLDSRMCDFISNDALRRVKTWGQKKGWRGIQKMTTDSGAGKIGLRVPERYLMYQEKGTNPYVMWSLEGKKIPIEPGRIVTAKGVGKPGWVTLPGGVKVYRQQKWRHPGLKPQHFMRDSVKEAIQQNRSLIREHVAQQIYGRTGKI